MGRPSFRASRRIGVAKAAQPPTAAAFARAVSYTTDKTTETIATTLKGVRTSSGGVHERSEISHKPIFGKEQARTRRAAKYGKGERGVRNGSQVYRRLVKIKRLPGTR